MRCCFRLFLGFFVLTFLWSYVDARKCHDGKLPLLEGAGDGEPFPCIDECPDGFDCEHPNPVHPIGICCPNLDLLYELYGTSTESSAETSEPTPELTTEAIEGSGEESSDVTETDEPELTTVPLITDDVEEVTTKSSESPDRKFLRLINEKELRLSPAVKAAKEFGFEWPPKNESAKDRSYEDHPKLLTSIEEVTTSFTCNRQKFEVKCAAGTKKTQIVVRWYNKNGECVAYPFGFCPGDTVKNDKTMRTREECVAFCIENKTPVSLQSEDAPTSSTVFPTLIPTTEAEPEGPIDGEVSSSTPVELVEVFPPGYGPEIDEDNKTRVILHSDVIDPIAVPLPNADSTAVARALGSLSQAVTDVNGKKKNKESGHGMRGTLQLLKMPLGPRRSSSDEEDDVEPIKTCHKITPYRSMCPTGVPTQFTLRWYAKAGSCSPYPYGYCHGELVSDETAIKTKPQCESLCLGNIASEAPFHLLRKHHQ
uniref:BPTI/Kunitz inhibitor domain-containing protein n=1 Tax=Panagrellus redivivus TaxID=6233 RepID=A0A7E4UVJ1_PANRE